MILTFLSGPEALKYWKLIGVECIWYPASFELGYPSIAVDFESRDEAIRKSSAVHYVADDDVWLVSGAGHYCNDNQSPWLETRNHLPMTATVGQGWWYQFSQE